MSDPRVIIRRIKNIFFKGFEAVSTLKFIHIVQSNMYDCVIKKNSNVIYQLTLSPVLSLQPVTYSSKIPKRYP